jgi:hypothetical protein
MQCTAPNFRLAEGSSTGPRIALYARSHRIVMTPLKDKIQDALDENRMLVLGAEILVGFQFTATFQDRFPPCRRSSGTRTRQLSSPC